MYLIGIRYVVEDTLTTILILLVRGHIVTITMAI